MDKKLAPMREFLLSPYVFISTIEYTPQWRFFRSFYKFCKENNLTVYRRVKYKPVWSEFGIKCARKRMFIDNENLFGRYLLGVGIDESGVDTEEDMKYFPNNEENNEGIDPSPESSPSPPP
jgi:hypothetical protein